jgi:NADH-quinone oxidoreductase subunit M
MGLLSASRSGCRSPSARCCWRSAATATRRWCVPLALIGALAGLLVTVPLIGAFDTTTAAMQFVEKASWIERFNVHYHLGVDGLSMWFVPLTAFITVVVVIAGWRVIEERVAQYMGAFLILSGLMIGVFAALDGLLFYVFFEATLIPMYIIIGIWGGPRRVYAAFKFFLYTLLGSLLMLVALVYLYFKSGGSFDIQTWHRLPLPLAAQTLLFFAFFAAFSVKVPMWPVHTWLPDAHVEAPTGGSVVLAAIMLKLGAYGFLRFSMPIAPDAAPRVRLADHRAEPDRGALHRPRGAGAAGHEEAGRVLVDRAHGLRHAGLLRLRRAGAAGGIVQMIAHGFVSAPCSCASACSTTACTRARSRPTAVSSTRCRVSPPSRCCSRWPMPGCRAPPASSASGWSSSAP